VRGQSTAIRGETKKEAPPGQGIRVEEVVVVVVVIKAAEAEAEAAAVEGANRLINPASRKAVD
jgi:hypothetical protein